MLRRVKQKVSTFFASARLLENLCWWMPQDMGLEEDGNGVLCSICTSNNVKSKSVVAQ